MFQFLKSLRELAKEEWANGAFTDNSVDGTAQLNAEVIGKVRLLQDLLEVSYEWVTEELSNGRE
jgi:hypothetical protein